jgi:SGNH hydrolase-like domain, acetyltransferase AlgX
MNKGFLKFTVFIFVLVLVNSINFIFGQQEIPKLCEKAKPYVYVGSDGRIFLRTQFEDFDNFDPYFTPWLSRFVQEIKKKGIQIIALPIPGSGSVYFDQITNEKPSKEVFQPFDLQLVKNKYENYINELNQSGIHTLNVTKVLQALHKENPELKIFFKSDGHWTPETAKYIAAQLSEMIRSNPNPLDGLFKKKYNLETSGSATIQNGYPIRVARKFCPDFNAPAENYPVYKAVDNNNGEVTQATLFGDPVIPVMLFGSSYSTKFSFAESLKFSLGSGIVNNALDGGLALGAMLNEFSKPDFTFENTKLIIWEFPIAGQMGNVPGTLNNIGDFRQLLPAINKNGVLIFSKKVIKPSEIINIQDLKVNPEGKYVRISFPNAGSRSFKLLITYRDFSEVFSFERPYGNNLNTFFLELIPGGVVRSFKLEQPEGSDQPFTIDLFQNQ